MRTRLSLEAWDVSLAIVIVAGAVGAWGFGIDPSLTALLVLVYLPMALAARAIAFARRDLAWDFARRPFDPAFRAALAQLAIRWALLLAWALVLSMTTMPLASNVPTMSILYGALFLAALLQLVPRGSVLVAGNFACALVALFWGAQCVAAIVFGEHASAVVLDPPFRAEMLVLEGGTGPLVNRHAFVASERHGIDITLLDDEETHHGSPTELGSYACFGSAVHAPADGTIVKVVATRPDLPLGAPEEEQPAGNYVILEMASERFLVLAHLERASILVHTGDRVHCGEVLARCGNSGSTTEPHLHVQLQDKPELFALDVRTFPIVFRNVLRARTTGEAGDGAIALRRGDRLVASESACR